MPEADLALMREAVAQASQVALRFVGPDAQRWNKPEEAGPVTEADLEVNRSLRETLRRARPGYGWLSEEDPDTPERIGKSHVFIVDPIDGTRSFIDGSRTWAISVGLVRDGESVAGVVALPARDLVYAAARGAGARVNGAPLVPSGRTTLPGAAMLIPRPALAPEHWSGEVPDMARHHRPSLAYRLCLAASGRFDGMLTLRDAWEWDIAAGAVIAAEAGCRVSDRTGAPLSFNSRAAQSAGVVVANPALHGAIVGRLRTPGPSKTT